MKYALQSEESALRNPFKARVGMSHSWILTYIESRGNLFSTPARRQGFSTIVGRSFVIARCGLAVVAGSRPSSDCKESGVDLCGTSRWNSMMYRFHHSRPARWMASLCLKGGRSIAVIDRSRPDIGPLLPAHPIAKHRYTPRASLTDHVSRQDRHQPTGLGGGAHLGGRGLRKSR